MTNRPRPLAMESLEERRLLASFPAYVDGVFTLGDPNANAAYGLENTFNLSSRPSASKTIYLDFDGHHSVNNSWGHNIVFPAYNTSGSSASFSNSELIEIQRVFQNVAEDFLPFDVNVTTKEPPIGDLIRSNGGDSRYGVRSVQTQATGGFGNGIGGVAYLNSFDDGVDNPVFAFNKGINNGSMTVSHEVGHALGLRHDGLNGSTYHPGAGNGATGWGPIMGAPFGKNVTQWSNGDYPGSTTSQDDLSVITKPANGFGFRSDDFGNDMANAFGLTIDESQVFEWGIIERNTDVDYFSFFTSGGDISLDINAFTDRPNLDIEAQLLDEQGSVVAISNPIDGTNASFDVNVPGGNYFLVIDGVGRDGRYSDYGSLGLYIIEGDIPFVDGDFNRDGNLDVADIDMLTNDIYLSTLDRGNPEIFDMTGDGLVNLNDRDLWLSTAGAENLVSGNAYLLGDANLDGVVDGLDFISWNDHKFSFNTAWSSGDFNADSAVDGADFIIWNTNKFQDVNGGPRVQRRPDPVPWLVDHDVPDNKLVLDGPIWPLGEDHSHHHHHGSLDHQEDQPCSCAACRGDAVFSESTSWRHGENGNAYSTLRLYTC